MNKLKIHFTWFVVAGLLFIFLPSCKTTRKVNTARKEVKTNDTLPFEIHRKVDYIFQEAIRLKNIEKHDAAFELLRYCMELDSLNAPVLYELSNYFIIMKQTEKSKALLKKANELDPENKWYKWALASVYLEEGNTAITIPIVEEIANTSEDNLSLLEILADLYAQTGQYEKTIEILNRIEEETGINEMLAISKFQIYILLKDEKKAIHEIDRLQNAFPQDLNYSVLKGDLLVSIKQPEKAMEIYEEVAKKDPANPNLVVSIANYNASAGKPLENSLRDVILNENVTVETKLAMLSKYTLRLNNPEQQADSYRLVDSLFTYMLEKYPIDTGVLGIYSNYLLKQERTEEGIQLLENLVGVEPENEKAWDILIKYYFKEKNFDKMVETTEKALTFLPQNGEFWSYLVEGYVQKNNNEQAMNTLRAGISQLENDSQNAFDLSELYGQMGDLYQKQKKEKEATEAYEAALKYNPRNIGVLNNYSYYLSQLRKDLTRAEWMAGKSIELFPNNPTFLDTYAWVYFGQGNYSLAKFYIERAINLGAGNNPEVVEHYGDILYMTGEKEKAVEQWKKAKDLGGDSEFLNEKIITQTYIE